jgi:hypothetical protein
LQELRDGQEGESGGESCAVSSQQRPELAQETKQSAMRFGSRPRLDGRRAARCEDFAAAAKVIKMPTAAGEASLKRQSRSSVQPQRL